MLPCTMQDEESQSWLTSPEPRGAGADAHDAVERLTEMYDEALAHTMRTVCTLAACRCDFTDQHEQGGAGAHHAHNVKITGLL